MLFNMLHFVSLPVGQVKSKNNLPEAILACLGQALISNPAREAEQVRTRYDAASSGVAKDGGTRGGILRRHPRSCQN